MSCNNTPTPLGVNSTTILPGASTVDNFLAVTAGTLTLTNSAGVVVLNAFPVAAGSWTDLDFRLGPSFTVTLAGGASGTLCVSN